MHIFEGFERGDLDLHFYQSIPPLSEGNLVDLDLGVLGVSPLCSSSLIPPLALVAVLGTGGRVVSDYRRRLTSDTVEALICLQDWLRAGGEFHNISDLW